MVLINKHVGGHSIAQVLHYIMRLTHIEIIHSLASLVDTINVNH